MNTDEKLWAKEMAWRRREKNEAHALVARALKNGSLEKKPCFCGENKTEAHHADYSYPLEVIWLCKKHHTEADKAKKKRENETGIAL